MQNSFARFSICWLLSMPEWIVASFRSGPRGFCARLLMQRAHSQQSDYSRTYISEHQSWCFPEKWFAFNLKQHL